MSQRLSLSAGKTVVLAVAVGILLTAVQARAVGGLGGMLQVGEGSTVGTIIEDELGPVTRAPNSGHDGQIIFAIATDLRGREVPPLLDHGGYRYRRILFPAVAAGFGLISGPALIWSFVTLNVASFATAAGATASLLRSLGRRWWGTLGVIANPGVWLSINGVTSDLFALSLALGGLVLMRRRHHAWAVALLALSALAKDQYLAVAFAAALWLLLHGRKKLAAFYSTAIIPLVVWSGVVELTIGEGFAPRSNFGAPFMGFVEAASNWSYISTSDITYSIVTAGALVVGLALLFPRVNRPFWPFATPWLAMGVFASAWVWQFGNNALRSLAPVILWCAFAGAGLWREHADSAIRPAPLHPRTQRTS